MRRPIIAGNWKMNKTPSEAVSLINELKPLVKDAEVEVVVCVPFVCIPAASKALEGSNIKLGAQNMHWEEKGAYTGEVAPGMLKELGVEYVIIGHSERRQYFAETDETVNKKIKSALKHGLLPIVCVGETLSQREEGITMAWVTSQVEKALKDISSSEVGKIVFAYEPIWAIGTGKTASSKDAEEVIKAIREKIGELYSKNVAENIRILYGGSVKPDNIKELMNEADIDGALVGGASLDPESFYRICAFNL